MAQGPSDAWVGALLDLAVANQTWYLALGTTAWQSDGTGGTETATSGYARIRIDNKMAASSGGSMTNDEVIQFTASAAANAGPFQYYAVFSASSGGTFYYSGQFSQPLSWVSGQPVQILVGNFTVFNQDT